MISHNNESGWHFNRVTRRQFVNKALTAASVYLFSPSLFYGCKATTEQVKGSLSTKKEGSGEFEQALELLARTGPEYNGGLSNHGPMAAEALHALGRDDAVVGWAERYRRRLQDYPDAAKPIAESDWREALGDFSRVSDWAAFFNRELKESPWNSVLEKWVSRLAPGLVGAATHGLIRTGHAVRSLTVQETEMRKRELAEGLGYWAARYLQLPRSQVSVKGGLKPSQAIKNVEFLPDEKRVRGLITQSLRNLDSFSPFKGITDLVDSSGDASKFLSDLTETFAVVFLTNAQQRGLISFIHAVTGPSAIRLLLPHLSVETKRSVLLYGWQAAAAIYTVFGDSPLTTPFEKKGQNREDLIDRAVASGDEHAIKFTEACLREHAMNPNPVYLMAARNAVDRLR
jgi:hypothetical protein